MSIPPSKVMLSLTGKCNLRCWHCPRSSLHNLNESDSPKELIDYVIEKIMPHCKYLRVGGNNLGEPMLSRNFDYFFSSLEKRRPKETHLVTNFTLLDEKKAETIVKYVDNLEISVEASGAAYSKIRNFSWQKIIENIELLQKYREKHKNRRLKVTLLVCAMLSNLENILELFELKSIGVNRMTFREFMAFDKNKDRECLQHNPEKAGAYIKKFKERSEETGMEIGIAFKNNYPAEKSNKTRNPETGFNKCYFPWTCVSIDNTGNVSCCCNNDLELARLDTCGEGLFEFWNNKKFVDLRKSVNTESPWPVCLGCERRILSRKNTNNHELS